MSERVFITGIGLITSLGLDASATWQGVVDGRSGVGPITLFDPTGLDTRIAAQLPDEFDEWSAARIKRRTYRQMTRVSRMAYVCAEDAVADAGVEFDSLDPLRCAVIMGIVHTGRSDDSSDGSGPRDRILRGMSNSVPAWIALRYGIEGPSYSVSTACASSAYALGQAYELIAGGRADLVIAGGADSTVNRSEIEGFNALYALSMRNDDPGNASRPFCADRDGFVIGEGAGVLILESEESVTRRGGEAYAEILGHAETSEAYNMMAPKKGGAGMARTMQAALSASGIEPFDVGYINAHGTSTTLNDLYETMAIKTVFGSRSAEIPVSSVKSMIGHTIGAAGAVEAAVTVLSIRRGVLTPTINYDTPDPELDLDYVPNMARELGENGLKVALSNSFAFGGHNAVLVFGSVG